MTLSAALDVTAVRTLLTQALQALDARGTRFVRRGEVEARERIERALAKLDDGTYGACDDCGRSISGVRLDAAPDSVLCVACAGRAQRRLAASRS